MGLNNPGVSIETVEAIVNQEFDDNIIVFGNSFTGDGTVASPLESAGGVVDQTIIDGSTNAVAGNAVFDAFNAISGGYTGTLQDLYNLIVSGLPTLSAPVISFGTSTTSQNVINWTTVTHATGYVLEYNNSGTWTNLYTGALLTFTHTGLTANTSYEYRVRAIATGYNASNNTVGSKSTNPASVSTPLIFANLASNIVYNSTANSYKPTYIGTDGFGNEINSSGKKLAAGADGAIYLKADGVMNLCVLGLNTTDTPTYFANMKVGIHFNQLAYPDLIVIDNGDETIITEYVTGVDYRLIRISGVWKVQSSSDNWVTQTDLHTLTYTSSVDLYPVGDIEADSSNTSIMINPRQSGMV
jgi:hypothetical protein